VSCPIWQLGTVFSTKCGLWSTKFSLSSTWQHTGEDEVSATHSSPRHGRFIPGERAPCTLWASEPGYMLLEIPSPVGILTGLKLQHIRKFRPSNGPFARYGLWRTYQGRRTGLVRAWRDSGWVFVSFRSANRSVYCAVRAEYLPAVHANLNGQGRVFMCIAIAMKSVLSCNWESRHWLQVRIAS
jgi:hypothetical protein